MNKESSIKQLKRIKQEMTHADDVNALDFAIRYMENKALKQIRAEIEGLAIAYDKIPGYKDARTDAEKAADWWKMYKKLVLVIIDKYREG